MLDKEVVERLKTVEGVKEVETLMETGGKVYFGDSETDSVIFGANKTRFHNLHLLLVFNNSFFW